MGSRSVCRRSRFPVDLTFIAARDTSVDEVNHHAGGADGELKEFRCKHRAARIHDFNHDPRSSFRRDPYQSDGRLVKVSSWL